MEECVGEVVVAHALKGMKANVTGIEMKDQIAILVSEMANDECDQPVGSNLLKKGLMIV